MCVCVHVISTCSGKQDNYISSSGSGSSFTFLHFPLLLERGGAPFQSTYRCIAICKGNIYQITILEYMECASFSIFRSSLLYIIVWEMAQLHILRAFLGCLFDFQKQVLF